ncbi:hypothetical protein Tco_0028146 [Tanacetum coccineum]
MLHVSRACPPQVWPSSKVWSWQELVVAEVAAEVPVRVLEQPGHPHHQSGHPKPPRGHQPQHRATSLVLCHPGPSIIKLRINLQSNQLCHVNRLKLRCNDRQSSKYLVRIT